MSALFDPEVASSAMLVSAAILAVNMAFDYVRHGEISVPLPIVAGLWGAGSVGLYPILMLNVWLR